MSTHSTLAVGSMPSTPSLSAKNLTKRFGGLAAVNEVSIDLHLGQIHALIGPNGAGKSTLANLLSGDLPMTSGQLRLGDHNATGWSATKMSQHGLGRSFQKTNVFLPLSVWDNVYLAAISHQVKYAWNPLHWFQSAAKSRRFAQAQTTAHEAIAKCKLAPHTQTIAGAMSHGEQRQLELAMTLATQPLVLLLDEPLAGMGTAEAERMIELLLSLKPQHAMMLVEHDMDAVFALADKLTVMVNGRVIASDSPSRIRSDPHVQAAYLGDEDEAQPSESSHG